MKLSSLLLLTVLFSYINCNSQLEKVQFELEKSTFKFSINSGGYKSRLPGAYKKKTVLKTFLFLRNYIFHLKGL